MPKRKHIREFRTYHVADEMKDLMGSVDKTTGRIFVDDREFETVSSINNGYFSFKNKYGGGLSTGVPYSGASYYRDYPPKVGQEPHYRVDRFQYYTLITVVGEYNKTLRITIGRGNISTISKIITKLKDDGFECR